MIYDESAERKRVAVDGRQEAHHPSDGGLLVGGEIVLFTLRNCCYKGHQSGERLQ